jgi:hypothetical protein
MGKASVYCNVKADYFQGDNFSLLWWQGRLLSRKQLQFIAALRQTIIMARSSFYYNDKAYYYQGESISLLQCKADYFQAKASVYCDDKADYYHENSVNLLQR